VLREKLIPQIYALLGRVNSLVLMMLGRPDLLGTDSELLGIVKRLDNMSEVIRRVVDFGRVDPLD